MLEIQDPRPISDLCPGARASGTHAAGKMEAMADDFTATATASASACPAPSRTTDPDFLSCVLQPPTSSSSRPDPDYAALRRLLIRRKPPSGLRHRMEWRCNGKGYVAYRNFLLLGIDGGAATSGAHSTPSNSGRWAPSPGPATLSEADSWSSSRDWRSNSGLLGRNISLRSKQSDAERHVRFAEPAYSFVGMHCIFDNCKASVTILKFGHASSDLLAYGTSDGSLMVCQVSDPPSVLQKLMGHSKDITALDIDHTGQLIFAGDAQGYIYTVSVNSHTGSLSRTHKNKSCKSKSPITTIQYRTFSLVAHCPVLLSCAQDGNLYFFSIATDAQGYLTLICSLKLASRVQIIRASFCPFLSLEKGEFIVTGSEDSNVYFYDLARPKNSCVNKLQGHGSPVIGVAWSHGENLLASSDSDGTVIVWKRAKAN